MNNSQSSEGTAGNEASVGIHYGKRRYRDILFTVLQITTLNNAKLSSVTNSSARSSFQCCEIYQTGCTNFQTSCSSPFGPINDNGDITIRKRQKTLRKSIACCRVISSWLSVAACQHSHDVSANTHLGVCLETARDRAMGNPTPRVSHSGGLG